jgi:hypothetical protein
VVLFLEIAISIFRTNSNTRVSIFKCKIAHFEYHRILENSMGCGSSSTADPKSGKPQNQTSTRPQENRVRKK